jgi:hypothetical protein
MADTLRRLVFDASTANKAAGDVMRVEGAVAKYDKASAAAATTTSGLASKVAGLAAGYFTAQGLIAGLTYSVQQAREAEIAERKLDFAYKGNTDSLKAFAAEMMRKKNVDDDAVVAQEALLASLKFNERQIKDIISASADLSAVTGGDLASSVDALYRSYGGSARQLGMIIPQVKDLTEAELRQGDAVKLVAELLDGQAANAMNTLDGRMTAATIAVDNAAQSLGTVLAPAVTAVANEISALAATWEDLISEMGGAGDTGRAASTREGMLRSYTAQLEATRSAAMYAGRAIKDARFGDAVRSNDVAAITAYAKHLREVGSPELANKVSAIALAINAQAEGMAAFDKKKKAADPVVGGGLGGPLAAASTGAKNAAKDILNAQYRLDDFRDAFEGLEKYKKLASFQRTEDNPLPAGFDPLGGEDGLKTIESLQVLPGIMADVNAQIALGSELTWAGIDASKEAIAVEETLRQAKIATASAAIGSIVQLNTAMRGSAVASRRLAQVQAVVDTYAAANKALAAGVPPWNFIAAASVVAAGLANVASINAQRFARGGDFLTDGPQLIVVGDNPGRRERVQVTPLSSPNYDGPRGGGISIHINAAVVDRDAIPRLTAEVERRIRRGLA